MKLFSRDSQGKVKDFFEKTGILFPKGKRSGKDRRSAKNRRTMHYDNYLVVGGTERREDYEMRSNVDRRIKKAENSDLGGIL